MAERRTGSKYWQTKYWQVRPLTEPVSRTLRQRVESWSRLQTARLDRFDPSDRTVPSSPPPSSIEASESTDRARVTLTTTTCADDISRNTIRELVEQRRRSDRPFAAISTQTLVRRMKQGVLTAGAQRLVAHEIALRNDWPQATSAKAER